MHRSLLLFVVAAAACTGAEREATPAQTSTTPIMVTGAGLQTPESVFHDAAADVYLVSNINGNPLDKDGNGFIARVTPDGAVAALKWIDGTAPGVTLNAPKGMAIRGDTLFVADIDVVRLFSRATGAPAGDWPVAGSRFLNDVAVGPDGRVYVTDTGFEAGDSGFTPTGTDAIWRFEPDGSPQALVSGEALDHPNGIIVDGGRVISVGFGTGAVIGVDTATGTISGLPQPPAGQLDGIVMTAPGRYLISSWESQAVYRLGAGGEYTVAVDSVEAPADIGWDPARSRLLIPLFTSNQVKIVTIR